MERSEIITILERSNAIDGEAIVADRLLEDPIVTNRFVVELFQKFDQTTLKKVKVILGAEDDSLFGFAAATAAWARYIYADNSVETAELGHGFELAKGEGTIIALTCIQDADKVNSLVNLANAKGANIIGVITLSSAVDQVYVGAKVTTLL